MIINRIIDVKNKVILINVCFKADLTVMMYNIRIMTIAQLLTNITLIFTDCKVLLLKAIINSRIIINFIFKSYVKTYNISIKRKSLIKNLFLVDNMLRTVSYQI